MVSTLFVCLLLSPLLYSSSLICSCWHPVSSQCLFSQSKNPPGSFKSSVDSEWTPLSMYSQCPASAHCCRIYRKPGLSWFEPFRWGRERENTFRGVSLLIFNAVPVSALNLQIHNILRGGSFSSNLLVLNHKLMTAKRQKKKNWNKSHSN